MDDDDITNESSPLEMPPVQPEVASDTELKVPAECRGVDPIPDTRLYVPDHEDWEVHIKRDSERLFCYSKHPGEDWFHLLLSGEIYVAREHEKYCLRCALRMGFLTVDRLFWQHRVPRKHKRVL